MEPDMPSANDPAEPTLLFTRRETLASILAIGVPGLVAVLCGGRRPIAFGTRRAPKQASSPSTDRLGTVATMPTTLFAALSGEAGDHAAGDSDRDGRDSVSPRPAAILRWGMPAGD
jgi:hypothetical protein